MMILHNICAYSDAYSGAPVAVRSHKDAPGRPVQYPRRLANEPLEHRQRWEGGTSTEQAVATCCHCSRGLNGALA